MPVPDSVFGTLRNLAWWQECPRAPAILVYGLVLLRRSGRCTFGRWSAPDIVVPIVFLSGRRRAAGSPW